jgi:SAM-dependent methyltransferase
MRTATTPWALGDYDRFARTLIWELGAELVADCGIGPGHRVLDVAAGSGNVALRAAEAGAEVVASDITEESLAIGEARARAAGLALDWVVADAQALPFADASFDVVTSAFGAIFAPDHAAVARELLRVCRPGGTIGMLNFTPEGNAAGFFGALAPYAPPPPPGAGLPLAWGDEAHVRDLLDPGTSSLRLSRRTYVERHPGGPAGYAAFVTETFGPVIAMRAAAADPAALDRDLLAFAMAADTGPPGGPAAIPYEYLLVLAKRS